MAVSRVDQNYLAKFQPLRDLLSTHWHYFKQLYSFNNFYDSSAGARVPLSRLEYLKMLDFFIEMDKVRKIVTVEKNLKLLLEQLSYFKKITTDERVTEVELQITKLLG